MSEYPVGSRAALLIGVPFYRAGDDLPDIPTVANDLHQLRLVLESSGYGNDVTVFPDPAGAGGGEARLVTAVDIRHQIRRACTNAPEGGVLLVYFTGHGVSYRGRDYLVPGEILSLTEAAEDLSSLVAVDLSPYLDACKARTIVFAIDACRENLAKKKGFTISPAESFGAGALDPRHKTRVATLYGCDKEQFCYFHTDLKMSLFTKALCTVLSHEHRARTVTEVVAATDEVLQDLVRRYKPGRVQHVHLQHEGGAGIDEDPVCEGTADPWRAAVRHSGLWNLVAGRPTAEAIEQLRTGTESVVADAWQQWQLTVDELPDDPWRDSDYFVRLVAALEMLTPPGAELSAAEVSVLLTAPFLAGAVHASGVRRLLPHRPFELEVSGDGARQDLEAVHQANARITDKARALNDSQPSDHAAIAAWLMHRCVLRQVGLWQEAPAVQLSVDLAAGLDHRAGFRNEHATALRGLASLARIGAEELDAFLHGQADGVRAAACRDSEPELPGGHRVALRAKALAVLLSLAGTLALDIQRLGEVVVDHIGIRDELDPADLRRAVAEAHWTVSADRKVLLLEARCRHPATHLALDEVCAALHLQLQAANRWAQKAGPAAGPAAGLPHSVSTEEVAAELDAAGRPVYETPLLQFRLAHNEIRDLLMGVRLYGDPALAVRELYQNALDACRYRGLRARFLGQTYPGSISIRQGTEDGRRFIECVDNGVGMGRRELETTFSRAGRRFVTSTSFLWEQAEWLRRDEGLRLWPNSQFGIGVFSYFMLADEIFVETARVDAANNVVGELLRVQISSSGSLFRITTVDPVEARSNDVAKAGGTRVRLYLQNSTGVQVSALATLESLLWYSEFDVSCAEAGAVRRWPARTLTPPGADGDGRWTVPGQSHAWWTQGDGALLADGVLADKRPFGYVVNLCGESRPTLSVDRKALQSWNEPWKREVLRSSIPVLQAAGTADFVWLLQLSADSPEVGQDLTLALIDSQSALPVVAGSHLPDVPVDAVGVWPGDLDLLAPLVPEDYPDSGDLEHSLRTQQLCWGANPDLLQLLRAAVWRRARVPVVDPDAQWPPGHHPDGVAQEPAPLARATASPRLEPLDYGLLTGSGSYRGFRDIDPAVEISHRFGLPLAVVLRRTRRYIAFGAVPPRAVPHHDLDRVADELDLALLDAGSPGNGPVLTAAVLSRQFNVPFGVVLGRIRTFTELTEYRSDLAVSTDSDHVCTDRDVEVLRSGEVFGLGLGTPDTGWLHLLLADGIDRPRLDLLLEVLGVPSDELRARADEVRAEPRLRAALTGAVDAAPASHWLIGQLDCRHLIVASARLGVPPREAYDRLRPFETGFAFRLPAGLPVLPDRAVSTEEAEVVTAVATSIGWSHAGILRLVFGPDESPGLAMACWSLAVAATSLGLGIPPRRVVHLIAPFQPAFGAGMPASLQIPTTETVDKDDELVLRQVTTRFSEFYEENLEAFVRRAGVSPAAAHAVLSRWGVRIPKGRELDMATHPGYQVDRLDRSDRVVLSRDLDAGEPFLLGRLSPSHVVAAASENRETVAATMARVERLAADYPVSPPDPPSGTVANLVPPPRLTRHVSQGHVDFTELIELSAESCAPISDLLRMLSAGQVDTPPLTEDDLADLAVTASRLDVLTLRPDPRRYDPDGLHPTDEDWPGQLDIVKLALRTGRTIGAATARVLRFRPILPNEPPPTTPEVEHLHPDWRDPIILSGDLDGQWLVGDDALRTGHVQRAAREAELTEAEVEDRLRLYAGYCGLALPQVPGDGRR